MIIAKRIVIIFIVLKIQPDIVTSVDLVVNRDFDCVKLASAMLSGISPHRKKLPKLDTAHAKDIQAFLNSLEETEDLRNCYI